VGGVREEPGSGEPVGAIVSIPSLVARERHRDRVRHAWRHRRQIKDVASYQLFYRNSK